MWAAIEDGCVSGDGVSVAAGKVEAAEVPRYSGGSSLGRVGSRNTLLLLG